MTPRFVLAVAANREVRRLRERSKELDQALRVRLAHLTAVLALKAGPSKRVPGFGQEPRDEVGGRREVRHPDIVVVQSRRVFLADAARRTSHRAEAQALVPLAWCAESDDA